MTDERRGAPSRSEDPRSDENAWLEVVRSELRVPERTQGERAAFRMRVAERIEASPSWGVRPGWVMAAVGIAAAVLWLAVPWNAVEDGSLPMESVVEQGGSGLLSYAYYETDYLESGSGSGEFLTAEYQALESAFDLE